MTTSPTAASPTLRVWFIDHSGKPGGGQLGLRRYVDQSGVVNATVALLGSGQAFDGVHDGVSVVDMSRSSDSLWRQLLLVRGLAGRLRDSQCDLIVANSTRAALITAILPSELRRRSVAHLRDDLAPGRNSWLKRLVMTRLILPRFAAFLFNSAWTGSTVPGRVTRGKPVATVYPVCGLHRAPEARRRRQGAAVFLSMSRLDRWKGVHVVLDATECLLRQGYRGEFRVVIAGAPHHADPSYARELSERCDQLGDTAVMVGHVADVAGLVEDADAVIAVSLTPEPFGQVVVQGIGGGIPVVAAREGGPVEILGEGGLYVEPGAADALADIMGRLIRNESFYEDAAKVSAMRAPFFLDSVTVGQMDLALVEIHRELAAVR